MNQGDVEELGEGNVPETNKGALYSGNAANQGEDRRVRRTKKQLKNALIELIAERGYDGVSVQEILDRADVGRTSFYTYFRSKEDLLLRSLDDLGSLFDNPPDEAKKGEKVGISPHNTKGVPKTIGGTADFSHFLFLHLEENRRLARILLGRGGIPIVREHIRKQFLEYFKNRLQRNDSNRITPFEREGTAIFASGALLSLILWWLDMDRPATPAKMGELFERLMWGQQQEGQGSIQ